MVWSSKLKRSEEEEITKENSINENVNSVPKECQGSALSKLSKIIDSDLNCDTVKLVHV